jgi:hypothetical protein
MRRVFACAVLLLAVTPAPAFLKRKVVAPRPPYPVLYTATSDAVVVGTITAVEDDTVKAKSHPDAVDPVEYKVLVVKVTDAVHGVRNVTHVRVALPADEFWRANQPLQPDGKFLFYLTQHSTTSLLVPNPSQKPVNLADRGSDELVRRAKLVGDAIKDPMTALKADDKHDRVLAAVGLVTYYRRHAGREHETKFRPADESKLILEALAEGDWTAGRTPDEGGVYSLVLEMNLEDYGWRHLPNPGQQNPAGDEQAAFQKWLADKGKDARVKQFVPKK